VARTARPTWWPVIDVCGGMTSSIGASGVCSIFSAASRCEVC